MGALLAHAWNNISSTLRHKGVRANRLQSAKMEAGCYTVFHWSAEIPRSIILQLLSYRHSHLSLQKETLSYSSCWVPRLGVCAEEIRYFFVESKKKLFQNLIYCLDIRNCLYSKSILKVPLRKEQKFKFQSFRILAQNNTINHYIFVRAFITADGCLQNKKLRTLSIIL